jgi:hypothetical protein
MRWAIAFVMACGGSTPPTKLPSAVGVTPVPKTYVDTMRDDARTLSTMVETPLAKHFLAKTSELPHVSPRTIYKSKDKKRWSRVEEPELEAVKVDEELYYETKYGSPLSYARPFDILGQHGLLPKPGIRYVDFGYGEIGSLRLTAALGWHATGIDVEPMLPVVYDPVPNITMLDGKFPADPAIVKAVGTGLDLFIAKNTLKRGYIHPYRPAPDPARLIQLEVTDDEFVKAVHDALAPGGWLMIYNICPALTPEDKPFVPWSDGRSPFGRDRFEANGFEVLEFDRDDTDAIRKLGHVLRWDEGEDAMDLVHDLSVLYTLARRR